MLTVLVHGFWGSPADWNDVLKNLPLGEEVWIPNLFEPGSLAPHHTLEEWVDHFHEELNDRTHGGPVQLIGYSMGGRLVSETLIKCPMKNLRALILSANPMELTEQEKLDRKTWENSWRQRFLNEEWSTLEAAWNDQDIFRNQKSAPRPQSTRMREMLGQALIHWSPRHHGPSERLKAMSAATTWAFGALDQKYVKVAKDLAKLPVEGQINVLENAGHRIPLERPDWIRDWILAR